MTTMNKKQTVGNKTFGKFWALLKEQVNFSAEYKEELKSSIVTEFSYGKTDSLRELYDKYPAEYSTMMEYLKSHAVTVSFDKEGELWRKRVIAAVCSYIERSGHQFDTREKKIAYAISVACRAANCSEFNKIPVNVLQRVYNTFLSKRDDSFDKNAVSRSELNAWDQKIDKMLKTNKITIQK